MYLMRIGPVGSEKPIARLDNQTYVDLSRMSSQTSMKNLRYNGL
jgi:hypothetical protein